MSATTKMTAQKFELLGEDPPGVRLELVNGEVAVSPSLRPRHSRAFIKLARILDEHIEKHDLGMLVSDVDTLFGEFDVRRPDLLFFVKSRAHLVHPDQAIEGIPDLCIEIISPTSGEIDREDNFKQYAEAGVSHYWIVDPQLHTAEAFELHGSDYVAIASGGGNETVNFPPFADLSIPLAKLWLPKE